MFNDFKRFVLLSISFLLSVFSYAQGLGNSPYSSIGIGDIMNYRGSVRNMGMGYAGSTLSSKEYINLINPAGLPNFKHNYQDSLVKFDVGFTVQYKTFKIGQNSSDALGANINHIAFLFPVSKVFSTGFVLAPYSIVQNNYTYTSKIPNDPFNFTSVNNSIGNGGIYQFQWMNGVSVSENLSLGLTASYNFGNITQEQSTQLIVDPNYPDSENQVGQIRKTNYSGLTFKPGFIYKKQLFKKDSVSYFDPSGLKHDTIKKIPRPLFFKFGGTVDFSSKIKVSESDQMFVRNISNVITSDSIVTQSKSRINFPTTYRIGTSLEKTGSWALAADLYYSNWSSFNRSFKTDSLNSGSYGLFLGAEIMPHSSEQRLREKNKIYKAHRIKTFRAGFSYSATAINIQGNNLYDYSFSLGTTIPVGVRLKGSNSSFVPVLPKLSIAFVVGQRSTFDADQLTETYYRLHLSMTIADKWFNKRRIQ